MTKKWITGIKLDKYIKTVLNNRGGKLFPKNEINT